MLRANVVLASYLALTALQFELTSSRTSTLWKLNTDSGKITTGQVLRAAASSGLRRQAAMAASVLEESSLLPFDALADVYAHDAVFYIIASTTLSDGAVPSSSSSSTPSSAAASGGSSRGCWVRQSPEEENTLEALIAAVKPSKEDPITAAAVAADKNATVASERDNIDDVNSNNNNSNNNSHKNSHNSNNNITEIPSPLRPPSSTALVVDETLDCGNPVNFTYYDYLVGVGQHIQHPMVPEPEVAYVFLKIKDETTYRNFDITALERRLKRSKRERGRSVKLYNQIGNYWRIVGDTTRAIECFRRALAMSPTNAEVLLNLARVLYHLQYLDDAIHLTRRSLEMELPGRSLWEQYFTLGEIFRAYGHMQESVLHLRHALSLNPHHEPIIKVLRDIENGPTTELHVSTLIIIVALVVAVFVVIITSSSCGDRFYFSMSGSSSGGSGGSTQMEYEPRPQRHFNRAMAMRSLKGLSSSRNFRHRKY